MAMAVCSGSPAEGDVLLLLPPDHQCCLSTEGVWPSLLGAAVRMWCSFHDLSHRELLGLRLQDYFVVKLLVRKLGCGMCIIKGLRQLIKALISGSHPCPRSSFLHQFCALLHVKTKTKNKPVVSLRVWGGGMTRTKESKLPQQESVT